MRWLLFAVVLVVSLGGAALGAWAGGAFGPRDPDGKVPGSTRRRATIVVGLCLLALGLRVVFRYVPTLEYTLFPVDVYAIVRPWWAMPFAFVVLGVGPWHMSTSFSRRGVAIFAVLLGMVAVQRLAITALFDPATVTGKVERDGMCMQSTGYTCGAASAVMLLAQDGIASDEREMSLRCWTNGLTGTDELCVCRGLRQKLEGTGREVVFESADWERLRTLGRPAMTTIKWSFMVDHWVVVLAVEDGTQPARDPVLLPVDGDDAGVVIDDPGPPSGPSVLVLDPVEGKVRMPIDKFQEKWRGELIWLR